MYAGAATLACLQPFLYNEGALSQELQGFAPYAPCAFCCYQTHIRERWLSVAACKASYNSVTTRFQASALLQLSETARLCGIYLVM